MNMVKLAIAMTAILATPFAFLQKSWVSPFQAHKAFPDTKFDVPTEKVSAVASNGVFNPLKPFDDFEQNLGVFKGIPDEEVSRTTDALEKKLPQIRSVVGAAFIHKRAGLKIHAIVGYNESDMFKNESVDSIKRKVIASQDKIRRLISTDRYPIVSFRDEKEVAGMTGKLVWSFDPDLEAFRSALVNYAARTNKMTLFSGAIPKIDLMRSEYALAGLINLMDDSNRKLGAISVAREIEPLFTDLALRWDLDLTIKKTYEAPPVLAATNP